MSDTKRTATANASHRPLNMQERYYSTCTAGACKAENHIRNFATDWAFSERYAEADMAHLSRLFGGGALVEKVTDEERQKAGIDFTVTYLEPRTGETFTATIDAKRRTKAAQGFWADKAIPELCFELLNNGGRRLHCLTDGDEKTDFILSVYEGLTDAFLIPFELARLVVSPPLSVAKWKTGTSVSGARCVFIPLPDFWIEAVKASGVTSSSLLRIMARRFAEAAEVAEIRERAANDNGTEQQAG